MKKTLGISLTALVLVAAAAAVMTLGAPQEVTATGNCNCIGSPQTTADECTDDVTCAAATSRLHNQLEATAGCNSFCQSDLNITMACTPNGGGGYWVCGNLTYQCEFCKPCPPSGP